VLARCRSYEERQADVDNPQTDNGREFCGREPCHPFELYQAINQIKHRRTEVRSPEKSGFCERLHRTVKGNSSGPRVVRRSEIFAELQKT
jgi:hypothetical protein